MVFLLETLPFHLTFSILFQHGGFNALESNLGRHYCWEFLKLMGESRRADLLCICRAVQLLGHPAHALFLLNYPPDSSIPENIQAWKVAERCGVGWEPDVQTVVLAMRAFMPSAAEERVFPWLSTMDLVGTRSEAEWKKLGQLQRLNYKFTEWWWNGQREAFWLERGSTTMGVIIRSTAKEEIERLLNTLKRKARGRLITEKERAAWGRRKQAELDAQIRDNNRGKKRQKKEENGVKTLTNPKKPYILTSEDKKKMTGEVDVKHRALQSILETVKQVFDTTPVNVFEKKLTQFAKLIAALEIQNPLIKWSLRLLFHLAAEEAGRSVWEMEFLMQKYRWVVVEKPLEKIAGIGKH